MATKKAAAKKGTVKAEAAPVDRAREHKAALTDDGSGIVRGRIPGTMLREVAAQDGDEAVWQPNPDGFTWTFFVRGQGPRRKRVSK